MDYNHQRLAKLRDVLKTQLIKKKTESSQKFIDYDNLRFRISWNKEVSKVSITVAEAKGTRKGETVYSSYNNLKKDMHFFALSKIKSDLVGWVNL